MSINPEDDYLLDLRTSCTRDEAAAKLLGWVRGLVRHGFVIKKDGGIDADQMITAPSLLGGSLQQRLDDVLTDARQKLLAAAEAGAPDDVLDELHAALADVNALIAKAHRYMVDFDEEIAKGADARIRVDPAATERTGEMHFTLASIDRWARERYGGLSIFEGTAIAYAVEPPPQPSEPPHAEARAEADPAVTDAAPGQTPAEPDAPILGDWRRDRADHFLATFAFLVDAFADKPGGTFRYDDGRLKVEPLAQRLAALAAEANGGEDLKGQSVESIKSRIENAVRAKLEQVPKK